MEKGGWFETILEFFYCVSLILDIDIEIELVFFFFLFSLEI